MSKSGGYLRDISSGKDFVLPYIGMQNSKITDNAAVIIIDNIPRNQGWAMLDCTNSKNRRFTPYPDLKNSIWKYISGHNDVNNANWIIGTAITIYGEEHAVLLRPKS